MAIKNTGFRIRIEKELRDEFVGVCHAQDKPAAQVLRDFIRTYIETHRGSLQHSLFDDNEIIRQ